MIALFCLGGVVYSLVEYVHHRHLGHWLRRGRLFRSHMAHHADPSEGGVGLWAKYRQRAPVVGLGLFVVGGPAFPVFGWVGGLAYLGGLFAGYLWSEAFHHAIHHRAPRNRWEAWMWRYHYVHHWKDPTSNYGFTSPLWDAVFRTYRSVSEVRVPDTQLPAGADRWHGIRRKGAEDSKPA